MRLWITAIVGILAVFIGCGVFPKETSAELDFVKLRPLLVALQPLIEKGFGEMQISQVESSFRALPVNETKQSKFPIVYHGIETELRVQVRKEDVDVVEIRFLGEPKLVEQIQHTIRTAIE